MEDVNTAVAASLKAFSKWSKTPYADRQKALLAFADALEKQKDDFANMLVQEQGKPVSQRDDPLDKSCFARDAS